MSEDKEALLAALAPVMKWLTGPNSWWKDYPGPYGELEALRACWSGQLLLAPTERERALFAFNRRRDTDTLTLREVIRYGKGHPYVREWHAQMSMGDKAENFYGPTPEAALDGLRAALAAPEAAS